MRNILNVIFDILTLMALVVAGVGHMLPWFRAELRSNQMDARMFAKDPVPQQVAAADQEARRQLAVDLMSFQAWHAFRSGIALATLAVLVALSLIINWGPFVRRVLVLGMFVSCLISILFITLSLTHYPITEQHRLYAGRIWTDSGFAVALAPVCFAAGFSLIRMIWTMPPVRKKTPPAADVPDARPVDVPPPPRPRDWSESAGQFAPRD